jgi:hypothetical protein
VIRRAPVHGIRYGSQFVAAAAEGLRLAEVRCSFARGRAWCSNALPRPSLWRKDSTFEHIQPKM